MPRTPTTGTISFTLEEFDYGEDCLTLELSIAYTISPYDPGVRYTKNGDGWPPSGGEVEDVAITVKSATGAERDYTGDELAAIQAEVDRRFEADDELRELLDERCYEDAGEKADDDADSRYEAARERRDEQRRERGK